MSMVVGGRKSVALKLSVGVWWKVAMVSRRQQQEVMRLGAV
jgi:hypothetical protein